VAESAELPYAWIGQEVHLVHQTGNDRRGVNYTLKEVNELGVCVSKGERTHFYPWSSILRIGLGHRRRSGRKSGKATG
jgi:hypothetical protein